MLVPVRRKDNAFAVFYSKEIDIFINIFSSQDNSSCVMKILTLESINLNGECSLKLVTNHLHL